MSIEPDIRLRVRHETAWDDFLGYVNVSDVSEQDSLELYRESGEPITNTLYVRFQGLEQEESTGLPIRKMQNCQVAPGEAFPFPKWLIESIMISKKPFDDSQTIDE